MSGVYEIKNTLNNYRYVGSSVNLYKRFSEHLNSLRNNKHHSIILQRAWNKYGEQHFVFNILEVCEPIKDTLLFIEQKYLDLKPKYNICKNAYNTQGVVFTQERKDKIGYATKHRVIKDSTRIKLSYISKNCDWNKKQRKVTEMFDLNGNLLKEFPSITDAAKYIGCENCRVNIKRTAQGKRNIAYGYIWKYKK